MSLKMENQLKMYSMDVKKETSNVSGYIYVYLENTTSEHDVIRVIITHSEESLFTTPQRKLINKFAVCDMYLYTDIFKLTDLYRKSHKAEDGIFIGNNNNILNIIQNVCNIVNTKYNIFSTAEVYNDVTNRSRLGMIHYPGK